MRKKRCTAVVLAAGRGKRMGTRIAKQYLEISGRPLLYYTLCAFEKSACIDSIVLVVGDEGQISFCKREIVDAYQFRKVDTIICGGKERYDSVWRALQTISAGMRHMEGDVTSGRAGVLDEEGGEALSPAKEGYVFIHDGARPAVTPDILSRCLEGVERYGACVAAVPVKDTIKVADGQGFVQSTLQRDLLWTIQTPQVFDFSLLFEAYQKMEESRRCGDGAAMQITDDAMVVESFTDHRVKLVEGAYENIKVTTPEDLETVKGYLNRYGI